VIYVAIKVQSGYAKCLADVLDSNCARHISKGFSSFDVLLTVHLSIFISVINQLNEKNVCFKISLFHASACFEHYVLIIRKSKLHYTASGIITPIGVMIPEAV